MQVSHEVENQVIFEDNFRLVFSVDGNQKVTLQGFGTRGGIELYPNFTISEIEDLIAACREAVKKIIEEDKTGEYPFMLTRRVISPITPGNIVAGRIHVDTKLRNHEQVAAGIGFSGKKGGYKQGTEIKNPYILEELADKLEALIRSN